MTVSPNPNLPREAMPWAKDMERRLQRIETESRTVRSSASAINQFVSSTSALATQHTRAINEVGVKLEENSAAVEEAKSELADLNENVLPGLDEAMQNLDANLVTMRGELDAAALAVANIGSEVDAMSIDLSGLDATLATTRQELDAAEADLATARGELASTANLLGTTRTELSGVKTDLTNTSTLLGTTRTELSGVATDLSNTKTRLTNAETAVSNANTAVTNLTKPGGTLDAMNQELAEKLPAATYDIGMQSVNQELAAKLAKVDGTAAGVSSLFTGRNLLTFSVNTSTEQRTLAITTNINPPTMFRINVKGYNYSANASDVDVVATGYAYTGQSITQLGYTSSGSGQVTVRFAYTKDANPKLVLLISPPFGAGVSASWRYGRVEVPEASISWSGASADDLQGWTGELVTDGDIAANYSAVFAPSAAGVTDLQDTNLLTQGWRTPGTVTINGGKISANTVTANEIASRTILAGNIKAGEITANEIKARTITAAEILGGTITANEIKTATITAASGIIADAAIQTAKIADGAISTAKIGDAQILSAKIGDGQIINAKIADLAVNNAKIANATILTAKIADAQITNAKIADLAVDNAKIANATIQDAKIANINAEKITAGTIAAERIGAKSIGAEKLLVGDFTNYWFDPELLQPYPQWTRGVNGGVPYLERFGQAQQSGSYYSFNDILVQPDEEYVFSARRTNMVGTGHGTTTTGDAALFLQRQTTAGTWAYWAQPLNMTSVGGVFTSAPIKIPADTVAIRPGLYVQANMPATTKVRISELTIRKRLNGTLIVDGSITADSLATNSVTTAKMQANSINGDRIQADTLDALKIKANSITSREIKANSITANEITTGYLTGLKINAGDITGTTINGGTITGTTLNGGTINGTTVNSLSFAGDYMTIQQAGSQDSLNIAGDVITFREPYTGASDTMVAQMSAVRSNTTGQLGNGFLWFRTKTRAGVQSDMSLGGLYNIPGKAGLVPAFNTEDAFFHNVAVQNNVSLPAKSITRDTLADNILSSTNAITASNGYAMDFNASLVQRVGDMVYATIVANRPAGAAALVIGSIPAAWAPGSGVTVMAVASQGGAAQTATVVFNTDGSIRNWTNASPNQNLSIQAQWKAKN